MKILQNVKLYSMKAKNRLRQEIETENFICSLEIRLYNLMNLPTTKYPRDRINDEIINLQFQYKQLTGVYYNGLQRK